MAFSGSPLPTESLNSWKTVSSDPYFWFLEHTRYNIWLSAILSAWKFFLILIPTLLTQQTTTYHLSFRFELRCIISGKLKLN